MAGWNMTAGGSAGGMGLGTQLGADDDRFYQNKLKALLTDPAAFQKTPGFQFALDTGKQAIERRAAASGMGRSGNVLAELMKYGTGLASQEYGATLDRLGGFAGREDSMNFSRDQADQGALGKWLDYGLSKDRLELDKANSKNQFDLGAFGARTARGNAKSGDWWRSFGGL